MRPATAALALSLACLCAVESSALPPLSEADRAVLHGSPEDPPPPKLDGVKLSVENQHYVTSNEGALDLFYPAVRDRGGAFVGVGTDQVYLLVGWQRASLVWVTDYDDVVVGIHALYARLLRRADSPAAFIDAWSDRQRRRTAAALEAELPAEERDRLVALFLSHQHRIWRRLQALRDRMLVAKVPSFMTHRATYAFVRDLVTAGRVRALRVDVRAVKGLQGVADATRRLGVPVRVLYLSNVESYWDYSDQFRANVRAFDADARALVVRTVGTWKRNRDYRYVTQPLRLYQALLAEPCVIGYTSFIQSRKDTSRAPDAVALRDTVAVVLQRLRRAGKCP